MFDQRIDLQDKRVVLVGTAATAAQAAPAIAEQARSLTVFQRTAHWLFPRPDYKDEVSPAQRWLLAHVPYYARWGRFGIFARVCDGVRTVARIDPDWPHQDRSCSKLNDDIRVRLTEFMAEKVKAKPGLAEKVIPTYPPFSDRIIPNTGSYLEALTRDNVELVTEPIREIVADAVIDAAGVRHEADVLIYATGFHADKYLGPMNVTGVGGVCLSDVWGDTPRAYLGMTVPGFPNFFMIWGPGTTSGNMTFVAETQVNYILGAVRDLASSICGAIECRQEVYTEYVERYVSNIKHFACSGSSVATWWKNAKGDIVGYLPFDVGEYWHWTRSFNPNDFKLAPALDSELLTVDQ